MNAYAAMQMIGEQYDTYKNIGSIFWILIMDN